uniref:Uncharacterized protein n=1 Tax=Anguilla anguilla TaxID=7936 RepID=A0A0E9QN56_ANGAN
MGGFVPVCCTEQLYVLQIPRGRTSAI